MVGTGIRLNPNTDGGSVFGCLLYSGDLNTGTMLLPDTFKSDIQMVRYSDGWIIAINHSGPIIKWPFDYRSVFKWLKYFQAILFYPFNK